jgi:predicted dehydrogenase
MPKPCRRDEEVTEGKIRVGLLGANPNKGWGTSVHVPAIAALPGFTLQAVGTTRLETARESAELFGAKLAFDDARQLTEHPEVDLVAITVKAPEHHRLAMLALAAGKHVYCEWPLAANTAQAKEMRDLAARNGVQAIVGLQARAAPAILHARNLIRDGYVGRVTAVRMACALPGGGGRRSADGLYVIDKANGASTLAIQGGHAIDALCFITGGFAGFSAVVSNQFSSVEVIETGEIRAKDAPDQILLSGHLTNGAVASVIINGGAVAGHGIEIRVFGTAGTLAIFADGSLNFQMSELALTGARLPERKLEPLAIPADLDSTYIGRNLEFRQPYPGVDVPRATIVNVTNRYERIGKAILQDAPLDPDFATGAELHALLDSIETASITGLYQSQQA